MRLPNGSYGSEWAVVLDTYTGEVLGESGSGVMVGWRR